MIKINSFRNLFYLFLFLFLYCFISTEIIAAESLSYSGRLVNTNGSPVTGPVDIKVELSYSNTPTTILCSQDFTAVSLSNGVFHLKLDLNCGASTLIDTLINVPAGEAASVRVTDVTHSKVYGFQALHAMPFSNISETAKQLVQMGATNGQVLRWNNTTAKWEPGPVPTTGTVTNVTATAPLTYATGTTTPVIGITQATSSSNGYLTSADWTSFNSKQGSITAGAVTDYYRGDKTWQTLNTAAVTESATKLYFTNARVLGVPLTSFITLPGTIVNTDTVIDAFGKTQSQLDSLSANFGNYVTKTGISTVGGTIDAQTGFVKVGTPGGINDATPKTYVDSADALKVNKTSDTMSGTLSIDTSLKLKGVTSTNYVTIKAHASSDLMDFILPQTAGGNGFILKTDGSGNLSWLDPATTTVNAGTVTSTSILDGTIVNVDISATANIDALKIGTGLVTTTEFNYLDNVTSPIQTQLNGKASNTLTDSKIYVGNSSNVATAVAVSGDVTLANTGAITLVDTAVAPGGTFTSVTVDSKGRVTAGTNPAMVSTLGVTAPITNSGSATAPVIAIPVATTSANGYLSSTDWTTFNNKQAAITTATVLDVGTLISNLQNGVQLKPYGVAAGNTGEIRFNELAANGTNYVALKSPDALAANVTYTLPNADGTNGQVLTTNSTGGLSWSSVATTSTALTGDVGGTLAATAIGVGKVTQAHLAATGTKDATTYLRGDYTWADTGTDVRGAKLTGLVTTDGTALAITDSVIQGFGKLQKQITNQGVSAVGGDLTGTLPNPTIAKLQGSTLTVSAPATKQVLKYNGSAFVNAQVGATDLSATGTTDATTYLAGDNTWKVFATNLFSSILPTLDTTGITKATSSIATGDTLAVAMNKLLFTQGDYISKTATNTTISGTLTINSATGFITVPNPISLGDAANKTYVDTADALKVNKTSDTMSGTLTIDTSLKLKGNGFYTTISNSPSATVDLDFILPPNAGTAGYVLRTNGLGVTTWVDPATMPAGNGTVDSTSIVDGSIVNVDISATANIDALKIGTGLVTTTEFNYLDNVTSPIQTQLNGKTSTTLTDSKIYVGNTSNVATAVAVSGDVTLANTGAITLANSGVTAGTYTSVTVDAKGRVTTGTNPATVSTLGVTAPITNTGTATAPVIAIPVATTSANGYLSSTDWTTFNNKQAAITTATVLDVGTLISNLQNGVQLKPYGVAAGNTGEIRFNELAANGTNYVALKSPDALAANVTYTLPNADGTNGQVLTTNSTGGLSWSSVATTSTALTGDVGGTISATAIGAGKVTQAHLAATGTKDATTYLRGDYTWADTGTDVRGAKLTGLVTTDGTALAITDSVIQGFGKLQKQITNQGVSAVGGDLTGTLPNPTIAKLQGSTLTVSAPATKQVLKYNGSAFVNAQVGATDLSATGTTDATTYLAGDNTWKDFSTNLFSTVLPTLSATSGLIATGNTLTQAMNKLLYTQGDYVSKSANSTVSAQVTIDSVAGSLLLPRTPADAELTAAANVQYVQNYNALFGQWTKSGSDTYRATGNVGIGTTSPGSTLDVKGTLRLSGATSGYVGLTAAAAAGSTTYTLPATVGTNGYVLTTDGTTGLLSWTSVSGASMNTLTGDVSASGIGSVTATVNFVGGVSAANVAAGANLANAATNLNTASTIVKRDASGNFAAGTITAAGVSSTAALALATAANGNINMTPNGTGIVNITGSVTASSTITSTAFYYSSDRRLKTDIAPIKGLEMILALNGVKFKWKKTGLNEIGLIAQDVEKVLPELVSTNPDTGLKAVKYGNLVAPLIEGEKTLYKMSLMQKAQIDEIKSMVVDHEDRLVKLERRVSSLEEENQELKKVIKEIHKSLKSK